MRPAVTKLCSVTLSVPHDPNNFPHTPFKTQANNPGGGRDGQIAVAFLWLISSPTNLQHLTQVDILAAGEMVNELCLVVGGEVEVLPAGQGQRVGQDAEDVTLDPESMVTLDLQVGFRSA